MSFCCFSRQVGILYTISTCIHNETEINGTVNLFRGRRDKLRRKNLSMSNVRPLYGTGVSLISSELFLYILNQQVYFII